MRTKLLRRIRKRFDVKIIVDGKYDYWIIYDKLKNKYLSTWSFNEFIKEISSIFGMYYFFCSLVYKNKYNRNQKNLKRQFINNQKTK